MTDTEARILIPGWLCLRCGHKWVSRNGNGDEDPRICPRCKSAWFDTPPRKNAIKNTQPADAS